MFFSNVKIAASQVAILYVLVAVGAVCDKIGWFTEKVAKKCTDFLFYIITPAVAIKSFVSMEFSKKTATNFLIVILLGFVLHFIGILISLPFFRKKDKATDCIFRYTSIYGNVGYMGLPLTNAVLGTTGTFYCSAIVMVFNMMCFTQGVRLMSEDKNDFKLRKLILNPGTMSVIIGLPLFLLSVKLPKIIYTPLDYIAELNTPIAMVIFGTYLANAKIKTVLKDSRVYFTLILKLIVLPLILLGILKIFSVDTAIATAITIASSAPSANNTVMFAAKYNRDARLASNVVATISFVSILTMPLMIAIAQSL